MAAPAVASADSFSVTPCGGCTPATSSFTAGHNDSFTLTAGVSNPHSNIDVQLAPGLLSNLTANTACLASVQHTAACQIGDAGSPVLPVYLVPPTNPAADVAGFDILAPGPTTIGHAELSLHQITTGAAAGQVFADLNLPTPGGPLSTATTLAFDVNGTLNGNPFTRMPTSCALPAPSTLIATYPGPTTTSTAASPDVNVSTTCGALPYAPQLAATAQKDSGDNGVAIQTNITQAVGEAANRTTSLFTPPATLTPNAASISLQNTSTTVGTAVIQSPLVPVAIPGQVFLTGASPLAPTLTIQFPAPFGLKLVAAINLATNATTFSNAAGGLDIPDVPITLLAVSLKGGPQALFTSSCLQPSNTLTGTFGGQNNKTATSPAPLTIANCSSATTGPTVGSKSLTGLSKGKPKLSFTVNGGGGPNLKTVSVKVGGGLKFAKKVKKGLKVSGGKVKSAKVKGGKLVITLKSAVSSVTVKLSSPALKESSGLKKKAKKKKVKSLSVTVNVTDANGTSTPLTLTFKNPK